MILKDLLSHFQIEEEFPEYLYEQTFNEVFLDGDFIKKDGGYEIKITTRQNVTHMMFINSLKEFPVVIMSELPNGKLNGMKFGRNKGEIRYINDL